MTTLVQQRPANPRGTTPPSPGRPAGRSDNDTRIPAPPAGVTPTTPNAGPLATGNHVTMAIVDATSTGLPASQGYYEQFKTEPSEGTNTLSIASVVPLDEVTLERAMTIMLSALGATIIKSFLIVGHGWDSGLNMLVVKGGPPTTGDVLDEMALYETALREAAAARAAGTVAAWKKVLAPLVRGARKIGQAVNDQVIPQLDGSPPPDVAKVAEIFDIWKAGQEKVLKLTAADFQRIFKLRDQVRAKKVNRLEFRVCRVGRDVKILGKLGKFIGASTVTGPDCETMFGRSPGPNLAPPPRFDAQLRAAGRGNFRVDNDFAVSHTEVSQFHYSSNIITHSIATFKAWLDSHQSPGYTAGDHPIFSAALRNFPGRPLDADGSPATQNFPTGGTVVPPGQIIVPGDAAYRKHIISVNP